MNYEQLTALHEKYSSPADGSPGLRILGFPCNQFGGQEPGTDAEIKEFATSKYHVKWDLASKIDVNGDNAHPLWKYMKSKKGGTLGSFIKWNFTKFLVDRQGQVIKRYGPTENPIEIEPEILKLLKSPT